MNARFGLILAVLTGFCAASALADSSDDNYTVDSSWTVGFVHPAPGRLRGGTCRISPSGVELSQTYFQKAADTRELSVTWTADVANADELVALIKDAEAGPFANQNRAPDVASHTYRASIDGQVVPLTDDGAQVRVNQSPAAATLRAFADQNCKEN